MAVESTVKLSIQNYKSIKQLAEDLGMSVRAVADTIVTEGLANAKQVGRAMSTDGNFLSKIQDEVNKLRADNLKLQTRLDDLESDLEEDEEEEPGTTLTKEDLLNPKRPAKPKELKEEQNLYCGDCLKERGKYVWLDPEKKPETCPECGRKLKWEEESGGGMGWLLAGVAALALLSGARR